MDEFDVQEIQPDLVYAYWDKFSGGRDRATGFDLWHVFDIIGHRT
jgi:hypothetical protein